MTEVESAEINILSAEMRKLQAQMKRLIEVNETILSVKNIPEYCTLEQACELKGGSTYKNISKRPWQQPCCGTKSHKYNGRRVWHRDEIIKWLKVTDETLEDYAKENGVDISRYFKNGKTIAQED